MNTQLLVIIKDGAVQEIHTNEHLDIYVVDIDNQEVDYDLQNKVLPDSISVLTPEKMKKIVGEIM
jgi:hypothetical protein